MNQTLPRRNPKALRRGVDGVRVVSACPGRDGRGFKICSLRKNLADDPQFTVVARLSIPSHREPIRNRRKLSWTLTLGLIGGARRC